jgi:hypothetical protein
MTETTTQPQKLRYEEVIDYLGAMSGYGVTVSAYPCFHRSFAIVGEDDEGRQLVGAVPGDGRTTLLGLQVHAVLGDVVERKLYEEQFTDGRAALRVQLLDDEGHDYAESGLTLTREWFRAASLDPGNALLRIIVAANSGAEPFYPAVGRGTNEPPLVTPWDEVGWGFSLDFDGSAPQTGRWSRDGDRWNEYPADDEAA